MVCIRSFQISSLLSLWLFVDTKYAANMGGVIRMMSMTSLHLMYMQQFKLVRALLNFKIVISNAFAYVTSKLLGLLFRYCFNSVINRWNWRIYSAFRFCPISYFIIARIYMFYTSTLLTTWAYFLQFILVFIYSSSKWPTACRGKKSSLLTQSIRFYLFCFVIILYFHISAFYTHWLLICLSL